MSQATKQKTVDSESKAVRQDGDPASSTLADTRAEVDRLFAVAAKSFATLQSSDSRQFLRRSQQTSGQ